MDEEEVSIILYIDRNAWAALSPSRYFQALRRTKLIIIHDMPDLDHIM